MPWNEVTVMSSKIEFIKRYLKKECSITSLCNEFDISRKTGYQLIKKYNEDGFTLRSRRPLRSPNKTSEMMENKILAIRDKHPCWGGAKIRAYLLNKEKQIELPHTNTINAILKRHGRITESESEKHKAWKRFEHEAPNDLWQIDFKGFFSLNNKTFCYPLTLIDDHSRYCLLIKACLNQRTATVQPALTEVFKTVGLPKQMTMDNGTPWGYSGKQLHTQFCAWLMRLGIVVKHSRPNHPQTQGKLERFHRTFKEELLNYYAFDNLDDAQMGFDGWLNIYNNDRPHGAIDLQTPASRYKKSERLFPEILNPIEYPNYMSVHKVGVNGLIRFQGKKYKVGEGFRGEPIGLMAESNNLADIYYCSQKILTLDLTNYCE